VDIASTINALGLLWQRIGEDGRREDIPKIIEVVAAILWLRQAVCDRISRLESCHHVTLPLLSVRELLVLLVSPFFIHSLSHHLSPACSDAVVYLLQLAEFSYRLAGAEELKYLFLYVAARGL
jgi:hypothetical protein